MIQTLKGTKDILPDESYKWQYIEKYAPHLDIKKFGCLP
jgi:histidyl-tRNA synthetase